METTPTQKNLRTVVSVVVAASLGNTVDYYDFFIAATAASLIWPSVFFIGLSHVLVAFLTLFSFASLYIVRPVGAYIFGHFGDRLGRRNMVVLTLVLMFVGVVGIALLPPLGLVSVILLIAFRMIQGVGLGGEFGGVASWVSEFTAASKRRSFWTGWIMLTVNLGVLLASGVFAMVAASMPRADLLSYGWRIPFVIGAIVLLAGGVIRWKLVESPLFVKVSQKKQIQRYPVNTVFREKWKTVVLLTGSFLFVIGASGMIFNGPYFLSLVTSMHNISITTASEIVARGAFAAVFASLLGMTLGDYLGRRRTLLIFTTLSLFALVPYYMSIRSFNPLLISIGAATWYFLASCGIGVQPAFFAEHFPTRYRYSGAGMSFQLAGFMGGMLIGFLQPAIVTSAGGNLPAAMSVFVLAGALTVIGIISQLLLSETKNIRLEDLDHEVVRTVEMKH